MKAHSSYFQRKNSKQGLALSTAMAICIVLAILVAVLVSMASLNINTTQATVSQREAYIQAKSALSFAESYYSQHSDQIPGAASGSTNGEALMVFNDAVVSNGATVYLTKDGSTELIDSATISRYKEDAVDTYIEVTNTASILDLTAYCKYGDENAYSLSREFKLGAAEEVRQNSFTGNILYDSEDVTNYLRVHVRTSPAFNGRPYLYTWYTSVNTASGDVKGKSSVVNKMSEDSEYATISNGNWGASGPEGKCSMTYEGNGWYYTEITTGKNVNFVNAIVTRNEAHRINGSGFNIDQQSWEFFGIPVPKEGDSLDVYITLNRNTLRDAVYHGSSDEFTYFFETDNGADINKFAKFCGSWYTVYTKKPISTLHYRKAGVYDDSEGISGWDYEGYGWWRSTTNNFGDSVSIGGNTFYYGQAAVVSEGNNPNEQVREGFICDYTAPDGTQSVQMFDTEDQANYWFTNSCMDSSAGNYITVNVKANQQPVDAAVNTQIQYSSKWGEAPEPILPSGGADSDSDSEPDEEPTSAGKEKLTFKKLATNYTFALVGDYFNNWGRPEGATSGDNLIENLGGDKYYLTQSSGFIYEITVDDLPAGTYRFKITDITDRSSGPIDWGRSYGEHHDVDGNTVVDVTNDGNSIHVTFNAQTHTTQAEQVDPNGGDGSERYAIAGWENDFGREKDGLVYSVGDWAATDDMEFDGSSYVYTSGFVDSGTTYSFKVVRKDSDSGAINWDNSWGGSGDNVDADGNFVFTPPADSNGNPATYNARIIFNSLSKSVNVELIPTSVTDEDFFLVGDFNDWANHTFNKATNSIYKFESQGVDSYGYYVYKYVIRNPPQEAGEHRIKVISSKSLLEGADGDAENSIDYNHSWGADNGSGVTMNGSGGEDFTYGLSERSDVEITFKYNPSSFKTSTISYAPIVNYDIGNIKVGFLNYQLKNSDGSRKTDFTSPWDKVFITYHTPTSDNCIEGTGTDSKLWFDIPEDAEWIYFSNKDSAERGTSGYECTEKITSSHLSGTYPFFFAVSPGSGGEWKAGFSDGPSDNPTGYAYYAGSLADVNGTGTMIWTGSSQNNYYDAPLVRVLNMLVSGSANGGPYAFAAYPYRNYEVQGRRYNFSSSTFVTYQGEKYYYTNGNYNGYSFLIVQDTAGHKGGILLANHMSLETDTYGGVKVKMDNRGGGVFTSDTNYYDGSPSLFNYGGYVPNWYTFKVPVTTELTIKKITGVTGAGDTVLSSSSSFTPVKVAKTVLPDGSVTDATRSNYPIYIDKDYDNNLRFYTYDIKTGSVDTSSDDKVSVYFDNTDGWSKVGIYAYNPLGVETIQTNLSRDSDDADNHYYKFSFDTGEYCYFQFFDSSTGSDPKTATKKTKVLCLTGYENADTHEYDILAVGENAAEFSPYAHPKSLALFLALEAEALQQAAKIPSGYYYNAQTGEYVSEGSLGMSSLESLKNNAKHYAEGSGPWSAGSMTNNRELIDTMREFIDAVENARIYLAEEVPEISPTGDTHYTGGGWVFKEGSYKDDLFIYQDRWLNQLKTAYNNALVAFSDSSKQNKDYLRSCIDEINILIDNAESELNPDAVQIIIDDQLVTDADGNVVGGNWGMSNIHLYNYDGGSWLDTGSEIFNTSQSGFYAFAFKLSGDSGNYMVAQNMPADENYVTMEKGKRYIFHTATGVLEADKSVNTYKVAFEEIKQGSSNEDYSIFKLRNGDNGFVLYFLYDTKITWSGGSYTIFAGAYTISSGSYRGFNTDLASTGAKGINLFTNGAKSFFENGRTTDTFSPWSSDIPNEAIDVDILCDSITKTPQISATTSSNKKINFRYKAKKNDDTLTLNQNVSLEGGVVTIAANTIDLNHRDFEINAKTVIFLTDTTVVTNNGSFDVLHGTYALNDTSSGATYTVQLQSTGSSPDWRDHYTLIDEAPSTLRGGNYVVKN